MVKFNELSDEELIPLINSNRDPEATSELFDRYKGIIRQKSRVLSTPSLDYEDLLQEGMIGLYQAILKYNSDTGVPFNFLAKVCINHAMLNALKASKRKKNEVLNRSISLNSLIDLDNSESNRVEFMNLITSKAKNPESILLDTEKNYIIKSVLSPQENQIFLLFLDGYSYFDIAKELNTTTKNVDNSLQRIKKKLQKYKDTLK